MSYKDHHFHDRKTTRLQNWDYGWNGWYFVTFVTKDFVKYFGKIENDKLGEFIIMPDHFHGLIQINKNQYNSRDAMHRVPTSDDKNGQLLRNSFGPQRKNLASIIRGYKSSVTMYAKKNNIPFKWQKGFIDRIIWNDTQLDEISEYIKNNPSNWEK